MVDKTQQGLALIKTSLVQKDLGMTQLHGMGEFNNLAISLLALNNFKLSF
jgi:hypothetical protein